MLHFTTAARRWKMVCIAPGPKKGEKYTMSNASAGPFVQWLQPSDLGWLANPAVPVDLSERLREGFRIAVWKPSPAVPPQAWLAATVQAGGVGFVDAPGALEPLTLLQAQELLSFLVAEFAANVSLMQLMLSQGSNVVEAAAKACGFQFGASLLLLGRACDPPEIEPLGPHWRFKSCGEELKQVLLETYEGTQDCPILSGKRPLGVVIEGYEATGSSGRKYWKTLYSKDEPVGCVLVAIHQKLEIAELVYMGLIPSARGNGLGKVLLAEAERMTLQQGLQQLVIGVDGANAPARRIYENAGYGVWEQKQVYLWFPPAAAQRGAP